MFLLLRTVLSRLLYVQIRSRSSCGFEGCHEWDSNERYHKKEYSYVSSIFYLLVLLSSCMILSNDLLLHLF